MTVALIAIASNDHGRLRRRRRAERARTLPQLREREAATTARAPRALRLAATVLADAIQCVDGRRFGNPRRIADITGRLLDDEQQFALQGPAIARRTDAQRISPSSGTCL